MMTEWEEIIIAREENRHEIVLTGPSISKKIEESDNKNLDPKLFKLTKINFLEVSRTCLSTLSPDVAHLINLTQLSLRGNQLTTLPSEMGTLTKLKYLDASDNKLESLPQNVFTKLTNLHTICLSSNALAEIPPVDQLKELHDFAAAKNKLQKLPSGLDKLDKLLQIDASDNQIESISEMKWPTLICLRQLNLSGNVIVEIPSNMSQCSKLRDLNLRNNKLKDNRLRKMTEDCKAGSILEYLKKQAPTSKGGKGKNAKKKGNSRSQSESVCDEGDNDDANGGDTKNGSADEDEEAGPVLPVISVITGTSEIRVDALLKNYRPYIMACIVRDVNLDQAIPGKGDVLKAFLKFQDQLHRTSLDNRKMSTIATHDNKAVKYPLTFTSRPGEDIEIVMLNSSKKETASFLLERLWKEADEERKRKKKNKISGVYEYLHLLDNLTEYPVLLDSLDNAISLPPITNCDGTKLSTSTTDILLEVSGKNFATGKTTLDQLVLWLAEAGVTSREDGSLLVEQVRVMEDGHLKVVYPSKTDLVTDKFNVKRAA